MLLHRLCCFPSSEHTKSVEMVSSEYFHFPITILVAVQVVLLGDSHHPQKGSLNIKCLGVNHSHFPLQPGGRPRHFLSFLSVDCKDILSWSELDI